MLKGTGGTGSAIFIKGPNVASNRFLIMGGEGYNAVYDEVQMLYRNEWSFLEPMPKKMHGIYPVCPLRFPQPLPLSWPSC